MNDILIACPACHTANRIRGLIQKENMEPICGKCKKRIFTGQYIDLDEHSFDAHILNSTIPILVDFWAPWCGPCRSMAPAFAEAASLLFSDAQLIKINTEENPGLAQKYNIRSIPTLLLFKNGIPIAQKIGALSKQQIVDFVKNNIEQNIL